MNKKTVTAVIILIALVCGVMTGCGIETEKTASAETVNLIIKTPPLTVDNKENADISEAYMLLEKAGADFAKQYSKANVTVKVVKFRYVDEKEYVTDCFGTESAPDILFEGDFNMRDYIYSGNAVPLDDVLSAEQKRDFTDTDLKTGQIRGRLYLLPYFKLQNTLCYNKDLFRRCGLEKYIGKKGTIQSWTAKEWDTILSVLAEKLPEMSYPMMMYAKNNQGDTHIMTLLRGFGCEFFDGDGRFHLSSSDGIAALQKLREFQEKGYFPPGCMRMEINDCVELFQNRQMAICTTNNASWPSLDQETFGLVNFPGKGRGLSTSFTTGFAVFDNGDEAKLQAAKDFLAYFYAKDEYLDYERVGIPANRSVIERSKGLIDLLDVYTENEKTAVDFSRNHPNWQGRDDSVRSVFWTHIHALLQGDETAAEAAEGIDRDCNAAIDAGYAKAKLHQ